MVGRKSNWDEAIEMYRELKEADRLDEIEPVPEEVHKRAKALAKALIDTPPRRRRKKEDAKDSDADDQVAA